MKQWMIVIISLTLIILLNFWQTAFLRKSASNLISKIEKIEARIKEGNKEKAIDEYENLAKVWERKELGFGIFCEHDSVEEIQETMSRIERYISILNDTNKEFALIECNNLKDKIEKVLSAEKLKLTNVL